METFYTFDFDNYCNVILHRIKSKLAINEIGCEEWKGAKTKGGYGQIAVKLKDKKPKTMLCHRILWELINQKKLCRSEYVCHSCGNKLCLNIRHLYVGTQISVNELPRKWRNKPRPHTRQVKFSDEQVKEMYRLSRDGVTSTLIIIEKFGISKGYISKIRNGKAKFLLTQ